MMERFRLRVRHEPRRGHIWELHLFPSYPRRSPREADGRVLGSSSTPEATHWLRQIAAPFLSRAEAPGPITTDEFGPEVEPHWLKPEDGMRLALAFSAARWLAAPQQRRMFRKGLDELPSEVILYWFTLCFYGYRQASGRAALRTLLTHAEPGDGHQERLYRQKRKGGETPEPSLFWPDGEEEASDIREGLEKYAVAAKKKTSVPLRPKARRQRATKK